MSEHKELNRRARKPAQQGPSALLKPKGNATGILSSQPLSEVLQRFQPPPLASPNSLLARNRSVKKNTDDASASTSAAAAGVAEKVSTATVTRNLEASTASEPRSFSEQSDTDSDSESCSVASNEPATKDKRKRQADRDQDADEEPFLSQATKRTKHASSRQQQGGMADQDVMEQMQSVTRLIKDLNSTIVDLNNKLSKANAEKRDVQQENARLSHVNRVLVKFCAQLFDQHRRALVALKRLEEKQRSVEGSTKTDSNTGDKAAASGSSNDA